MRPLLGRPETNPQKFELIPDPESFITKCGKYLVRNSRYGTERPWVIRLVSCSVSQGFWFPTKEAAIQHLQTLE